MLSSLRRRKNSVSLPRAPHPVAKQQACGYCPQHVLKQPVTESGLTIVLLQEQSKHDEMKRHAIVEPCLTRQAETDKIIVLGINHLHQGCKNEVSGREDRPYQ